MPARALHLHVQQLLVPVLVLVLGAALVVDYSSAIGQQQAIVEDHSDSSCEQRQEREQEHFLSPSYDETHSRAAAENAMHVTLHNGVVVPSLAFGMYQMTTDEVASSMDAAIEAGYRHFDTAAVYRNEHALGQYIKTRLAAHKLTRADLFITSKLSPSDQGYEEAKAALQRSLDQLGIDHLDLYLIHWPGVRGLAVTDAKAKEKRAGSWRALEEAYAAGKVRAIGVSNYMVNHIEELLANCKVVPMVNQVEQHPQLYQPDLLKLCKSNNIVLEAYSPLGQGHLLKEAPVVALAQKYNKTPAQVLIRWGLQHSPMMAVKSSTPSRVKENFNVFDFEIDQAGMESLNNMSEGRHFCWDPYTVA